MLDLDRGEAARFADRAMDFSRDLGRMLQTHQTPPMVAVACRIADALAQTLRLIATQLELRVDARALREEANRGLLPPDAEERWGDPHERATREHRREAQQTATSPIVAEAGEMCAHCGRPRGHGRWAARKRMHWPCVYPASRGEACLASRSEA